MFPTEESCPGVGRRRNKASLVFAELAKARRLEDLRKSNARGDGLIQERLVTTSLFCDAVIILYAFLFSYWLRFKTPLANWGIPFERVSLSDYVGYIAFGVIGLLFTLTYLKLYERQTLLRDRHVAFIILRGCTIWMATFLSFALVFKCAPPISRAFAIMASGNAMVALLIWRHLFHRFLRTSEIVAKLRQTIVFVGWNEETERLTQAFHDSDICAYQVIGCVSSRDGCLPEQTAAVPVLGEVASLEQLIQSHAIDIVMVADLDGLKDDIVGIANLCEKEMVQFKVIPSYFQILVSGLELQTVSGIPVLGVSQLPLDRLPNILLKRLVDIVGAVIGLIGAVPLTLIFGTLVYLESPGPIFYRQRRLGRNGMEFDIIKIRSMRLDAEKNGQVGWSTRNDSRRLEIGEVMRKWNIDEIPQFWNVLTGEMSLVGPRPERPELIKNFKEEIPHYNARHNAKPGITGWAQVKGFRGDTDLGERIRCDLFYLEHWSLGLDAQILAMTLSGNKNAC